MNLFIHIIYNYKTKTNGIFNKMYGYVEPRTQNIVKQTKEMVSFKKNVVKNLHKNIAQCEFFCKKYSLLRKYMIYYSYIL